MFKGIGSKQRRRVAIAAASVVALGAGAAAVATTTASAAVKPSGPAAVARCTSNNLAVWLNLSEASGAAGTIFYPLEFTNTGKATCFLDGYPGVSALNASGQQLGSSSGRNPQFKAVKVVLFPGNTAHADLGWADVGNFPKSTCKPASSALIRVYAPNAKKADLGFASIGSCSAKGDVYLHVTTVQPGPNSQ